MGLRCADDSKSPRVFRMGSGVVGPVGLSMKDLVEGLKAAQTTGTNSLP